LKPQGIIRFTVQDAASRRKSRANGFELAQSGLQQGPDILYCGEPGGFPLLPAQRRTTSGSAAIRRETSSISRTCAFLAGFRGGVYV